MNGITPTEFFTDYASRLQGVLAATDWSNVSYWPATYLDTGERSARFFFVAMVEVEVM